MSVANARQFLEILANQPEVKDQLYTAGPANARELLSFGLQKGYAFSEQDLRSALSEIPDQGLANQLSTILQAS